MNLFFKVLMYASILSLFACSENSNKELGDNLKSVEIRGEQIHYLEDGEGETILFVHGGIGDYRVWSNQYNAFKDRYHVITYSRRYAYPNRQVYSRADDYSIKPHAKDIIELIDRLSSRKPVHLVGHSYGGYAALYASMKYPDRIQTLTLIEPPVMSLLEFVKNGTLQVSAFFNKVLMPPLGAFNDGDNALGVKLFVNALMNDPEYFEKASKLEQDIILNNVLEMKGGLQSNIVDPQVSCDDLAELEMPVLVVNGERSPRVFETISYVLDSCIVDSKLNVLPEASHRFQMEHSDTFNEILGNFLANTE